MRKKILFLAGFIFIALVLECGERSEENITKKQLKQRTGSEENVDISKETTRAKTKNNELKMDAGKKTNNLKQERNLKMEEAKPINVSDEIFESEVIKSDIPVLVDFWAPWCGPCRMAAPVLEKIAQEYQGRLKVCKLNVDKGPQTAMKYSIMSIPTLNIYKDGEVVDQIIGVTPSYESDITKKIKPYLEENKR